MPGYVTLSYGLGLLGLPLAVFVPPPRAVARRAARVTGTLLALGLLLLVAAVAVQLSGYWYEGLAVGGGALATLFLMFWAAAPRGRAEGEEDDGESGGGGGGNVPKGPADDPEPGGDALDWGDFDRFREQWGAERAPERELLPV